MNLVIFKNVSKTCKIGEVEVAALGRISLAVPKGSFTALAGPSGRGKTTALNMIGCLNAVGMVSE
jgi:putative ABC transport system ATP-binding protein